jgi:hypothetical protein
MQRQHLLDPRDPVRVALASPPPTQAQSEAQPFVCFDACLFENLRQQRRVDITFMRVKDEQTPGVFDHELVVSPGMRTFKSKLAQILD